jgi:pentalenene oxygenase
MARVVPVFGDAFAFRADKLGFMLRASRRGAVVELKLGRGRTFLLNDPADIRHVLLSEEPRFPKHPRLVDVAERSLFGEGLVAASEEEHRAKRLSLQPAFNHRELASYAGVIEECVDEVFVEGELDLVEASFACAHRVRQRVLFGERVDQLASALEARQRYISQVFVSPLPFADRLPTRVRRNYRHAQATLERELRPRIRRDTSGDLVSLLRGLQLCERRVFDEARGFLASYELSARGLMWTLLLVAERREVQDELRRDTEVMGYAQQVYSEGLRLYPPTWLFVRMAPQAVELPSGSKIPRDARLFICPYSTHRDERLFPQPERFDPSRSRPRAAYLPFGGGRHVCLGEAFVRLEAAIVLTRVFARYDMQRADKAAVTPHPAATLELRGAPRLNLSPRPKLH